MSHLDILPLSYNVFRWQWIFSFVLPVDLHFAYSNCCNKTGSLNFLPLFLFVDNAFHHSHDMFLPASFLHITIFILWQPWLLQFSLLIIDYAAYLFLESCKLWSGQHFLLKLVSQRQLCFHAERWHVLQEHSLLNTQNVMRKHHASTRDWFGFGYTY